MYICICSIHNMNTSIHMYNSCVSMPTMPTLIQLDQHCSSMARMTNLMYLVKLFSVCMPNFKRNLETNCDQKGLLGTETI